MSPFDLMTEMKAEITPIPSSALFKITPLAFSLRLPLVVPLIEIPFTSHFLLSPCFDLVV